MSAVYINLTIIPLSYSSVAMPSTGIWRRNAFKIEAQLSEMEIKISNDEISSFIAATKLLDSYFKK